MNKKYDNSTKQKDKTNHYKTKLRDYKDRNKILQSNNVKLKHEISQLSDDNKKLKSSIEELKKQVHEFEISKEIEQKAEKKQKRIDFILHIFNYIGEIIIYIILLYGVSTNTTGNACASSIVIALILVLINISPRITARDKFTSLFSPFKDLIIDILQSFVPLIFTSLLLWFKQDDSLPTFLDGNVESMTALGLLIVSVFILMIVITILTYLILLAIYFAIKLIKKIKIYFAAHTCRDSE